MRNKGRSNKNLQLSPQTLHWVPQFPVLMCLLSKSRQMRKNHKSCGLTTFYCLFLIIQELSLYCLCINTSISLSPGTWQRKKMFHNRLRYQWSPEVWLVYLCRKAVCGKLQIVHHFLLVLVKITVRGQWRCSANSFLCIKQRWCLYHA